jgi:hypothetical protein
LGSLPFGLCFHCVTQVCLRSTDATTKKPTIMEQWHSFTASKVQCPATWIYVCVGNDHRCDRKVPLVAGTGGTVSATRCENSYCLPQYSVGATINKEYGYLRYMVADGVPHFYPVLQQLTVDRGNKCAMRLVATKNKL